MEYLKGKHFSITDSKDVNTVIYEINKTEKSRLNKLPKYTVKRLDSIEELRNDGVMKTFFVDFPKKSGNQLLFLSFSKDKVTVNYGVLKNYTVKFVKRPSSMNIDTIYKETENDYYKEYKCTPNMKMPIPIIDPESGEELKPILYYDSKTNEVKGKYKLKPNKSYLAFRIN